MIDRRVFALAALLVGANAVAADGEADPQALFDALRKEQVWGTTEMVEWLVAMGCEVSTAGCIECVDRLPRPQGTRSDSGNWGPICDRQWPPPDDEDPEPDREDVSPVVVGGSDLAASSEVTTSSTVIVDAPDPADPPEPSIDMSRDRPGKRVDRSRRVDRRRQIMTPYPVDLDELEEQIDALTEELAALTTRVDDLPPPEPHPHSPDTHQHPPSPPPPLPDQRDVPLLFTAEVGGVANASAARWRVELGIGYRQSPNNTRDAISAPLPVAPQEVGTWPGEWYFGPVVGVGAPNPQGPGVRVEPAVRVLATNFAPVTRPSMWGASLDLGGRLQFSLPGETPTPVTLGPSLQFSPFMGLWFTQNSRFTRPGIRLVASARVTYDAARTNRLIGEFGLAISPVVRFYPFAVH